jgi:acyl-CoA synthetase (AMP-forming)/AMP-acid ligase II
LPTVANLASLLWQTAIRRPDQPAVVARDGETSYAALRDRAAGVAEAIQAGGYQPGDRGALLVENSSTAIACLLGIHAAGLVALVINERLRPRQIEHQLRHSAARFLLTNPSMLERLPRALNTEATVIDAQALPSSGKAQPLDRGPSDFAQIIYTSGSTGLPKGVVFTHGALDTGVSTVAGYLGQTGEDRVASLLALSTVYGLNQVLTSLLCGATLVVETSPLVAEIVTTLRAHAVTVLAAVPPLWLQLLSTKGFDASSLPRLRLLQNAGGHLPVEAVRRVRDAFPSALLFLQYGQTETFRGTFLPPGQVDRRPGSMGRAIPGADLMVLREDGSPAAPGEIGELVHAGPTIATGYWNDPEATARVFRPHPDPERAVRGERVVFSGDLVKRDAEGFFTFVSRSDRLIKTMGFRVGPDEIADILHASGETREAVVTSEPDSERGSRIVAFVVLREGGDVTRLTRFCRAELPPYMLPARIEAVSTLPRLPSGKYDMAAFPKFSVPDS